MKPGDKITTTLVVEGGLRCPVHAIVRIVSDLELRPALYWEQTTMYLCDGTVSLSADSGCHERFFDDEGITWISGWSQWWWPPSRRRTNALLAAYALSNAAVEIRFPNKNSCYRPLAIAAQLQADFNKVAGSMEKALRDLENVVRRSAR